EFRLAALHIAPVEPRLKDAGVVGNDLAASPAPLMALGEVALAPAVTVGVDSYAERVVTGVDRTAELVVDPVVVAHHIELEDLEAVDRGLGRRREAGLGDAAQDHAVAKLRSRLGDRGAAPRLEALERADRGQQHRDAQLAAKQGGATVDLGNVAQYPRS